MKLRWVQFKTILALGLLNVLRVIFYRLSLRSGRSAVQRIQAPVFTGPFFHLVDAHQRISNSVTPPSPSTAWETHGNYFGYLQVQLDKAPRWFVSPHGDVEFRQKDLNWWKIPDFDPQVGDIKMFWEASRFDWTLPLAQRASRGSPQDLHKLNEWIEDWLTQNPPYKGPNWKCGQEASLRLLHLSLTSFILGQHKKSLPALLLLMKTHLQRIAPTMSYAIAQDNNHGTSEAAALYVGGALLEAGEVAEGKAWREEGLKWLENRVARLFEEDGTFSQYSMTYHRMALDTLSIAEVFRRELQLPEFSDSFYRKTQAAVRWLWGWVDETHGDAPNLGANDGARLFPLVDADYRDFRPSVHLASVLFLKKKAWNLKEDSFINSPLKWLKIPLPDQVLEAVSSAQMDQGGFLRLIGTHCRLLLHYPRFRFRPNQADALHVDFWLRGKNIFRDGGTYSYNAGAEFIRYFSGTESHNTIQFDDHDQMPRLSRFLFGAWLKTRSLTNLKKQNQVQSFQASYRDIWKAEHSRQLELGADFLRVVDIVQGFKNKAVLRWRLAPGAWQIQDQEILSPECKIKIFSSTPVRVSLERGWESRYYYHKEELPVLTVEINKPGTVTTEVGWSL